MDDVEIPHHHSRTLLDRLLAPHLPPVSVVLPMAPGSAFSPEQYATYTAEQQKRLAARSKLVRKVEVNNFGTIEEFDGGAGKVIYVEAFWGQHQRIGLQEGVQDIVARTFQLGRHL